MAGCNLDNHTLAPGTFGRNPACVVCDLCYRVGVSVAVGTLGEPFSGMSYTSSLSQAKHFHWTICANNVGNKTVQTSASVAPASLRRLKAHS